MCNGYHIDLWGKTGWISIGRLVLFSMISVVFAGNVVGEITDNVPSPEKDLAIPMRESAALAMSQAPWRTGLEEWLESNLSKPGLVPFSFLYEGKSSKEFLAGWEFTHTSKPIDKTGTKHFLTYLDKKTGLEVCWEVMVFDEHPAVEWMVKFKNTEGSETAILADIQALDAALLDAGNEFTLHHAQGVGEGIWARKDDFRPISRSLMSDSEIKLAPQYGRSSWGDSLPFFNIEMSNNRGVILGIGWTGQWCAKFTRKANQLYLQAGMERTHLKLYPGEAIRTPKILLLFWQRHRIYGQNLLRRIILAHYHPQKEGKPLTMPFLASAAALYHESFKATEQNQIEFASQFASLGVEYLWMDVGWHVSGSHIGPVDRQRFPNGLQAVSDVLKKMNMGLLVWFAPEFQGGGNTWMEKSYPSWFLRLKNKAVSDPFTMLNFGDKNALALITDCTSAMIQKEGIGIYRLDGPIGANCPHEEKQPLPWWRDADAPDRQGITEIRYIEGLYWFWDELVRRNPGLIVDLCGGGATRIDLEAMSRCVYLWRSDWDHPGFEPVGQQAQTYGASLWLPSTGIGSGYPDTYSFRSSINNGVVIAWNPYQPDIMQDWPLAYPVEQKEPYTLEKAPRTTVDDVVREGYVVTEPFPWEAARRLTDEFKRIRHFFYGDFYPLTPYSTADDAWMAFQCHKEDLQQGMVLAFRRAECPVGTITLKLWGLSSEVRYEVFLEDGGVKQTYTGKELTEGLDITIDKQPGSLLITYQPIP